MPQVGNLVVVPLTARNSKARQHYVLNCLGRLSFTGLFQSLLGGSWREFP